MEIFVSFSSQFQYNLLSEIPAEDSLREMNYQQNLREVEYLEAQMRDMKEKAEAQLREQQAKIDEFKSHLYEPRCLFCKALNPTGLIPCRGRNDCTAAIPICKKCSIHHSSDYVKCEECSKKTGDKPYWSISRDNACNWCGVYTTTHPHCSACGDIIESTWDCGKHPNHIYECIGCDKPVHA